MIVTSDLLGATLVGLLQAQAGVNGVLGLAGVPAANIFGLRALPTQQDQLPQIQLELPSERKQSMGRVGGNQFLVVATLPLIVTAQAPAAPNEAGAAAVRGQLAAIVRAIETTVIGAPALQQMIQRVLGVQTHPRIDGTGQQITGQHVWMIDLEYRQDPEDFYVQTAVPLETISVSAPPPPAGDGAQRLLLDDLNPTS